MPLFNYGRTPGYAPGGRKISAETGRIGDMPGGLDYLAGYGPAPAGVVDFNPAAIVQNRRLASPAGNPLSAFTMGIQKWGNPATNTNAISMFNQRHGVNLTPQQLGVQTGGQVAQPTIPSPTLPQAGTTPIAQLNGTVGSFNTQWNDQNDPGGLIRKWQQQQANQPWSSNLSGAGSMYGLGGGRSIGG